MISASAYGMPGFLRIADRGRSCRVWQADDDIRLDRELPRQLRAHALANQVQPLAVDHAVGPREIDQLEEAHRLLAREPCE